MKLHVFTIALDGLPFLFTQFATLNSLRLDWMWHIVEGASENSHCTSWCRPQAPRLSKDGTTSLLNSWRSHPRIRIYQKQLWPGKVAMCNTALEQMRDDGVLLQLDADEIWRADQIEALVGMFEYQAALHTASFYCRYFWGWNLVSSTKDDSMNDWRRAWRFKSSMRFTKHEPPVLAGCPDRGFTRDDTRKRGLIFDHYSWCLAEQVQFKEAFYGRPGAFNGWSRLQHHRNFPVRLKQFLSWEPENSTADLLHK